MAGSIHLERVTFVQEHISSNDGGGSHSFSYCVILIGLEGRALCIATFNQMLGSCESEPVLRANNVSLEELNETVAMKRGLITSDYPSCADRIISLADE